MKLLFTFLVFCIANYSWGQVNYSPTNFRYQVVSYSDISTEGTLIPMTDPAAGVSNTPVDIGFTFNFFGTNFTQFTIHADGIMRLGTTAPGAATLISVSPANSHTAVFTSTNTSFQNIIMPFFTNLVEGSNTPEFHVLTSGTAPNRVCTIQWKNLRDADNAGGGIQHQFSNLEFQVKLYETTNDVEILYGSWLASSTNAIRRNAVTGIKANASNFLAIHRANQNVSYNKVEVLNQVAYSSFPNAQHPFSKSIIPQLGSGYRFFGRLANDINLAKIYADSIVTAGTSASRAIEVLVQNEGTTAVANVEVQLQVSGANSHTVSANIASLAAGAQQAVSFPPFALPSKGDQVITATVVSAGDERAANNNLTTTQRVSQSHTQIYDYSRFISGIGFNNVSGFIGLKVFGTGVRKISQIRIPFSSYRVPVNVRIHEDGGVGGSPSAAAIFTSQSFLTTSEQEMIVPIIPAVEVEGDFFIVLHQQVASNAGWGIGLQAPSQFNRYFNNTTGTWGNDPNRPPWHPLARVYEENSTPDIGIERLIEPGCDYSNNTTVRVSLRNFSSVAIDFSATPATITGSVLMPDSTEIPFSVQKNNGVLAAGLAEEITVLTGYNYTQRGFHRFRARTVFAGDSESGNDSLNFFINNSIPITVNPSGPVCPLTPVTISGVSYLFQPLWEIDGLPRSGTAPVTITPTQTTVVKYSGTDYRGCLLQDSVIVQVTNNNLPPKPVLMFGDTVLSHRNQFKDTVRVTKLDGHTIRWLGDIGTPVADSALIINQIAGLQGARVSAAYVRTGDACANTGDTITYGYKNGVLMNENTALTVCDTSFYDAGGPSLNTGNTFTRTFTPATPGSKMRFTLYRLDLSNFASLQVFDGPNISSPRIEALSNAQNGNTIREFIASNEAGVLTIQFQIGSNVSQGWWAGLTCYTSEVYRTVADGNWNSALIWERKIPGGSYMPATRPPAKGDDTVYIRHNITLISSQPMDQVVVEEGAILNFESTTSNFISMPAYKVVPQPEFLIKGTLNVSPRVQIFGNGGQMQVTGRLNNFGQIDLDTVAFTGTNPQILGNFSGASGTMRILRLDNPAGLTLGSDQTIRGIHFVRGMLNTSSENLLTLNEISEFTNGARDEAHVNGPLAIALGNAIGTRLYPIGSSGRYRPVQLSNTSANGEGGNEAIIVTVLEGPPPARSLPASIANVSNLRYYRVTRTGTVNALNFKITLPYLQDDGVTDPATLTVAKDDGASAWIDIGGTPIGTTVPGTIESDEFNTFSDFVLANTIGGSNPLPVRWQLFEAKALQANALLEWRTAQEYNCSTFEVERSRDGANFEVIGTTACRNMQATQQYNYTDKQPGKGTFYYRLRQVDTDGTYDYSAVRKVSFGEDGSMKAFPNPVRDRLLLTNVPGNSDVRMFDAAGRMVLLQRTAQPLSELAVGHLAPGLYELLITTAAGERLVQKIIVQR